jgi:hypothetical protein
MMPGFKHLTNFEEKYVNTYRRVARAYDLDFIITTMAYNNNGDVVDGFKGFWIAEDDNLDLSKFWKTLTWHIGKLDGVGFFTRLRRAI